MPGTDITDDKITADDAKEGADASSKRGPNLPKRMSLRFEPVSLFTVKQVTWATFVGGPVAGAWLLRWNYLKLGSPRSARKAVLLGLFATAVLFALAMLLPDGVPTFIIPLAYTLSMQGLVNSIQGERITQHLREGGEICSGWRVARVAAVSLVATVGIVTAVLLGYQQLSEPDSVQFGNEQQVFYDDGATQDDARRVGELLVELGYFGANNGEADAFLVKTKDGFALSFVLTRDWFDDDLLAAFRDASKQVSAVLDGATIEVKLVDPELNVKNTVWSIP